MRTTYRYLAYAIAALVVAQAALISWAFFGTMLWVSEGGVLSSESMQSESTTFDGVMGFMLHAMTGMMLIPLLALGLLVVAFFTRTPGAVRWGAVTLGLVVLQVLLGMLGHGLPLAGLLHGGNALLLLLAAVAAARTVSGSRRVTDAHEGERLPA